MSQQALKLFLTFERVQRVTQSLSSSMYHDKPNDIYTIGVVVEIAVAKPLSLASRSHLPKCIILKLRQTVKRCWNKEEFRNYLKEIAKETN